MSEQRTDTGEPAEKTASAPAAARSGSFVSHAKLIGFLTLISRILGMARESVAAAFFGPAGWSAFTVAFTIPNLFRKLFGEGALSAAFIPLYAQAVKQEQQAADCQPQSAQDFANASVNLLVAILVALTIIGELVLLAIGLWWPMPAEKLLAVKLTAIMLPYVLLVCGTAFLGSILQVHKRFAAVAAVPILLNLALIVAILLAARFLDLSTDEGQTRGVIWLSVSVLVAGVLQVLGLVPSLRAVGFRFRPVLHFWTPPIQRMLKLSIPVAIGAGVLQLSVMIDRGLAWFLAAPAGDTHFSLLGLTLRYPLIEGAAARLNWAQYLYQFPLGVFAIALATAIFPSLSDDALEVDRERFRHVLRRGIEAALFIGLPASVGLILVREPAVALLFERGSFTPDDTYWVALATGLYASAIWAFSLQQILNRAYYALHDTLTPLVLSIVTLIVNLVVELPLMWTGLREAGMAAGTAVSFGLQAVVMIYLLSRRIGGMGLRASIAPVMKMLVATVVMLIACLAVQRIPGYPGGAGKTARAMQLMIIVCVGGISYFAACAAMGINVLQHILPRRRNAAS